MFFKIQKIIGLCLCLACFQIASTAQPSLALTMQVADQRVYGDLKKPNLFYYMPFDYVLVTDGDGRPAFSLIQMRYTGTSATADAGKKKHNNLLQFKLAIDPQHQKKVAVLKAGLQKQRPQAELRPLPVRKFSSVLLFAQSSASGEQAPDDSAHIVKTNFTEATDENAAINNSFWTERTVTLRLNDFDAQLVEAALKNHQSVMSFSYGIYTAFSEASPTDFDVYAGKNIRKQLKDFFEAEMESRKDSSIHITMVKAGAINLNVDIEAWPSLIQKVDINEKLPAKYPLFDVYCYDFANEMRADLFAKRIEIKATSVNGSTVLTSFSFKQNQLDVYAKSIRFAYAVRFDKPFHYRVTEITNDGEIAATEWKEKKEWSEILDITSTPDKVVMKPKPEDE